MDLKIEKVKQIENKFLSGIIPDNWLETVTEYPRHFKCNVKGEELSPKAWKALVEALENEFNENLLEVYSLTDNGIHFDVFLRKQE